ncbi:MAG: protein kinase [Minicystis sp.]
MTAEPLFAQRFLIERLAGSGGMGRVYRAVDQHTGRVVAVKVLASNEVEAARFRREAALLADLSHPRIVRAVAYGETEAGEAYLAMEWLDGEDLAARLARGEPLGVTDSVRLAQQAAEALGVAHARGIVHRDVKPSNIFLVGGSAGDVKVIDFGIALVTADARRMTRTGVALGTLGYMAPEQARGERDLDPRADVFALGCVLFECLAGRTPFVSDLEMSILARILIEEAPRVADLVPGIPPALDDLVARLLAKDPAERPRDGTEVADALAALDAPGAAPARAARTALTRVERRVLCVIFVEPLPADEAVDSAEAPTVAATSARAVVAEARAIAEAYGARLSALADDTLVITLSGRGAATDQAARAARSALALRAAMPGARIVLCTGRGEIGDRFPTGEVIDRAARLLRDVAEGARSGLDSPRGSLADEPVSRRAPAAPVHLDDVTSALLDIRFDTRVGPLGAELHGERELFDTARTLLGKPTPFVGRDREMAALEAIVAEARSDEVARAVLVTAPPGTGKSRLRRELLHRLRARGEPVEVWLARGDPVRSGAPFGLIADALRSAAGLDASEPIESRRRKLADRVGRRLAPEDARRVAEFLGEIAGAPFPASVALTAARSDASLMADQVTRAFRDLLEAECAEAPALLVIEDLHWGDLPSIKLVDATLRSLADRPLVVLALARPEVADVFPRLWAERPLSQLRLGELSRKSGERLVREILGRAVPQERVDRILARAAGNALYLEELIRAEANGEGDALPETVLAMVQARLTTLDDEARRALRAASVFGLDFRLPGVVALLGARPEHVAAQLDELCDREIVERRGDGRLDARFGFRHALFREAAYAALTPADRALGHRLAAAWLAEADERDPVVLAEHHERGGELAKATHWYRRAAEQALEASDLAAAQAWAERGIACGATGEDLGALRLVEADVHASRGEPLQAKPHALEAIALLPVGSVAWLRAVTELTGLLGRAGDIDEMHTWLERLRDAEPDERDAAEALAIALVTVAGHFALTGWNDLADAVLADTRARLARVPDLAPLLAARIDRVRGIRSMYLGDPGAALDAFRAACRGFAAIGDQRNALRQQVNVGLVLVELGMNQEAERDLRDSVALAERLDLDAWTLPFARRVLSRALWQQGALAEARAIAESARNTSIRQGDVNFHASARQYLAEVLAMQGELEAALTEVRAALDVVENSPAVRKEVLGAYADLLLRAGRAPEAVAYAREVVEQLAAEGGGMAEGESRLRLVYVEALDAAGDPEGAREALKSALVSLSARAARIHDPALRRSFLERVPENARLVALAREHGLPFPV